MRVLFCGQSSYPSSKSATSNRYRAIADIVSSAGMEVIFVNRHAFFSAADSDVGSGIYRCVSPSGVYRSEGFLVRQKRKIFSLFMEVKSILDLHSEKKVDFINVYTQYFHDLIFYWLVGRFLGAEIIVHLVEVRTSFQNRSTVYRLNDWFFERFVSAMCDRFVVISERTASLVRGSKRGQVLVVPPVCDFDGIGNVPVCANSYGRYFLYCASAEYEDVAWFVIQSFIRSALVDEKLVLVLSGDLSERIASVLESSIGRIVRLSRVPYGDLISLYKNAIGLLIPLRDCVQDASRFPQKISEYLASKGVIVTTDVGEISKYFRNGENAIVVSRFDVSEYASSLRFVALSPLELPNISLAAYETGLKYFDCRSYVKQMGRFLRGKND